MIGFMIGQHIALMSFVAEEAEYQRLCDAAKASGGESPSREAFFGPSIKWEAPAPKKDGDWWSLGLAVLIGGML
jgi:hypothetical protein